jgi:outer membrane protein W
MRTLLTFVFVSLLFTSTAFAQEKNELTVFLSDVTDTGVARVHQYGGFGAAFSRTITPNLSAQLSVASEEHYSYGYYFIGPDIKRPLTPQTLRTFPLDLAVRYHWLNDTRWKPYMGAGLRYVGVPHNADPGFRYHNHLNPEIVGGVELRLRPNLGLTLDAR